MISDIDNDVSKSNIVCFADETRIYTKLYDVTDCDILQKDLNHVYVWAATNNMFNAQRLYYITFNAKESPCLINVYMSP